MEVAGEFPKVGAEVSAGDFVFTVMEVENNRVKLVKVTMNIKG
ncbi:MAG: transporter associated domain-containing protein [Bacteroidota bacterium]